MMLSCAVAPSRGRFPGILSNGSADDRDCDPSATFWESGFPCALIKSGDSITEQYQYSTYIELYLTTRFPGWDMTFLNAGISGDTADGGARRFASQILAEKPSCVTIDFGMNDGGYGAFDAQRQATFLKGTTDMLEAARKAGVRVALISPNAVEIRTSPLRTPYLYTQRKFYSPLHDLAGWFHVPFVDQYAVTRKVLERIADDDAPVRPFPDGVHTNEAGGLLMAHTILVGLHAPALVSDVEIDASAGTARTSGCTVDRLAANTRRVRFTRTDAALPMPVLRDWRPLLLYVDDLKDLNWYGLKVTGLDSTYTLRIDGQEAGTLSDRDLARGVNLGNLDGGPFWEQSIGVFNAIQSKNAVVHERFRDVLRFQAPAWLADVATVRRAVEARKRMARIEEMQAEVYRKALPKPRRFELLKK
jgi:lysophospholipase L1-like esterase